MSPRPQELHLAAALDGAGWHPAAWREPDAVPAAELFRARYWVDQAAVAQAGLLDFVTIEDGFTLQSGRWDGPDERTDQVRGRLDAALIAARVAPVTEHIGLVPTVTTTHTEPFHVSKSLATLDYASTGRAGWRAQVGGRGGEAALFGRRETPRIGRPDLADPATAALIARLFGEAADHVEAVRRLWDSWEDDAEIRDAGTGRFVDRDKLHYIDFTGPQFSVRGPSITPRPPQGQPPVVALAHGTVAYEFAASSADVVFVTPASVEAIAPILDEIRALRAGSARSDEPLLVFADLVVFLDQDDVTAAARKARLDAAAGEEYTSDAHVYVGTAPGLADLVAAGQEAGLDGFRLRPAATAHDLTAITRNLVPALQSRGLFRTEYRHETLRGNLGFTRPANRYAAV
jgi:alkanesulfonate monooxygenase SsuD/methylene tetrahydromethanopterin reductase-like flavin-dependent oxidoreductase (luciferase family)